MKNKRPKVINFLNYNPETSLLYEFITQFEQVQVKKTSSTIYNKDVLLCNSFTFYTMNNIKLLNKIKKYILDNLSIDDKIKSSYIKYNGDLNVFGYVPDDFEQYFNTFEIDISSCYITTAFMENIISEELFNKLYNLPKEKRLRFLGAIATKKEVFTYQNGVLKGIETVLPVEKLRFAWNYIVNKTFENMIKICEGVRSFLLFWVDAVFFHDKNDIQIVQKNMQNLGYNFKVIDLEYSFYIKEIFNDTELIKFIFKKKHLDYEKYIYLPKNY